tara:strand:+ start:104 stop:331 length:228 start_codon:yes stop_codon:yes gene_type:complete
MKIHLDMSVEDLAKHLFSNGHYSMESIIHNLLKIHPDKLDEFDRFVAWVKTQDTVDKRKEGSIWQSTWIKMKEEE